MTISFEFQMVYDETSAESLLVKYQKWIDHSIVDVLKYFKKTVNNYILIRNVHYKRNPHNKQITYYK